VARREKQAETQAETMKQQEPMCQLIDRQVNKPERATAKVAETFNTNRTYVSEAVSMPQTRTQSAPKRSAENPIHLQARAPPIR